MPEQVLLLVASVGAVAVGVAQLLSGAGFWPIAFLFAVMALRLGVLRVAVDADHLYVRNPFWTYTVERSKVSGFQIEKIGPANVQIEALLWEEPRPVVLKATYRISPAFLGLSTLEPIRVQLDEWLKARPAAPSQA